MKLVRWSFHNVHMPMISDEEGELFCTSKMLCNGLQISEKALQATYLRHQSEFSNCTAKRSAIDLLKENKVELGLKYVRGDMRLWSEDDMLTFAILSKSSVSKEFRTHLLTFIKQNARRGYVSKEQWDMLEARMSGLEEIFRQAQAASQEAASAAGASLAAHKGTKHLRLVP